MQSQPWLVDGSMGYQGGIDNPGSNPAIQGQLGNSGGDLNPQTQPSGSATADGASQATDPSFQTAQDAIQSAGDASSLVANTRNSRGVGESQSASKFADRNQISDFFGGGGTTTVTFLPRISGTFGINGSGDALQPLTGSSLDSTARSFQSPTGAGQFQINPDGNIVGLSGFSGQPAASDGGEFIAIPQGVQEFNNGTDVVTTDVYQIRRKLADTQISNNASRINIGTVKISEGTSALPQDRIFFNYSYFDNTNLGPGGVGVHRFTPGFEKSFNEGNSSIQMRFPFASTLDNEIFVEGFTDSSSLLVGDIHMAFKTILSETDQWLVSGGVQWTIPTAGDISFNVKSELSNPFSEFMRIETDSVHVLPFLSAMYVPQADDRFWLQGFLQFDFDVNGNPVLFNDIPEDSASRFSQRGRWNEATFAYLDISAGYEIYRDPEGSFGGLTSFAPMFEFHYNRSITNPDHVIIDDGVSGLTVAQLGDPNAGAVEVINLTVGMTATWDNGTNLSMGFATPVSGGDDRGFDGELRVLLTKKLGQASSGSRTQFQRRRNLYR